MNLASIGLGVWYEGKEQEEIIKVFFFFPLFNEVRKTSGRTGLMDIGNFFWPR